MGAMKELYINALEDVAYVLDVDCEEIDEKIGNGLIKIDYSKIDKADSLGQYDAISIAMFDGCFDCYIKELLEFLQQKDNRITRENLLEAIVISSCRYMLICDDVGRINLRLVVSCLAEKGFNV